MRDKQARDSFDSFASAVKRAQQHREYTPEHRLNLALDGLAALQHTVEFLLLRHRERADEHRVVLAAFTAWLAAQDVIHARTHGGGGYVRVAMDELIEEFLREGGADASHRR